GIELHARRLGDEQPWRTHHRATTGQRPTRRLRIARVACALPEQLRSDCLRKGLCPRGGVTRRSTPTPGSTVLPVSSSASTLPPSTAALPGAGDRPHVMTRRSTPER